MTRPFGQLFDCPHCGKRSTLETAFSRWTRNHGLLDSAAKGVVVIDQDLFVQQFKTYDHRDFECIMWVETKTHGGTLTEAQRDTLHMVNQLTRNRRKTPTKNREYQSGDGPVQVYSSLKRRRVWLRAYGVHVLRFSGLGPEDSEWMRWDEVLIDEETLIALLRFDLDPDTLRPIDLRSHHAQRIPPQLRLM